jgi:DNA-binding NarL/FixJ family response regulator
MNSVSTDSVAHSSMMRKVVAAVEDLFFAAKIRGAAEGLHLELAFPRADEAIWRAVEEAARENRPTLLILDLHSKRHDVFALIVKVKTDAVTNRTKIVAFFSHVETELMRRAKDAGADRVVPRSAFVKNLPAILRGEM